MREEEVKLKEREAKQREERKLGLVGLAERESTWERKRHLERREENTNK